MAVPVGRQGRRKAEKRRADLGMRPPEDVGYVAPPPDECHEWTFTVDPSGGNMTAERVKVRMVEHMPRGNLVEFAVVQETWHKKSWCPVAVADSSHDDEVHVHIYGRRAQGRVGQPEVLMPIDHMDDIGEGYDLAYAAIVEQWEPNKRRWDNA